jgi:hypothetical protein
VVTRRDVVQATKGSGWATDGLVAVGLFVAGGLFLGGVSQVLGDMLSAPDIAQPIEPLWPLVNEPISLDVLYYSSVWWNLGLLVVAVLAHLAMASRYGLSFDRTRREL